MTPGKKSEWIGVRGMARVWAISAACVLVGAAAAPGARAQSAAAAPSAAERPLAYLQDDAEMNAAITQARRTLPRFVSIHQSRNSAPEPLEFLALAAVPDGAGGHEYRWLKDVMLAPDAISGVASADGAPTSPLRSGAPHTAHPDEVADWMVTGDSGFIIGGYTLRVLVARGDAETQKQHEGRFLD